jgi:tRNA(Arg) A34 adenosine deaminase TadA
MALLLFHRPWSGRFITGVHHMTKTRRNDAPVIRIAYPGWVADLVDFDRPYASDTDRMRVAVDVARENVRRQTGGPFGAAVFEAISGTLVAIGINRVVPLHNSVLHAEIVAIMMAQAACRAYTLGGDDVASHELFTSCEPCAMCLGATHWSGVQRVVWAATREDAGRLHFDEGPVFQASYAYLERRGIRFEQGPLRDEARIVLADYATGGGEIYNA